MDDIFFHLNERTVLLLEEWQSNFRKVDERRSQKFIGFLIGRYNQRVEEVNYLIFAGTS